MKVHHIGYLVKDIEKSISAFECLGYSVSKTAMWDSLRKAYICFLENDGCCIELIAPKADSDLFPLLKQYGNAPYHMCYFCEDLEKTIADLNEKKFMLFLSPAPAPAIGRGDMRVAFLMNSRAGMIELLGE